MSGPTMHCEDVDLALALTDPDLRVDPVALRSHLETCAACGARAPELRAYLASPEPEFGPLPVVRRPELASGARRSSGAWRGVAAAAVVGWLAWFGRDHTPGSGTPSRTATAVDQAGSVRVIPSHYSTSERAAVGIVRGRRVESRVTFLRSGASRRDAGGDR